MHRPWKCSLGLCRLHRLGYHRKGENAKSLMSSFASIDRLGHQITSLGGLRCIVISHPHFYTTYVEWAKAFNCPVYTAAEDAVWLHRTKTPGVDHRLIQGATETVLEGVTAIKTGGHFDGSLVLHWERNIFIADSLLMVQVSAPS